MKKLLFVLLAALILTFAVGAKEYVIYENNFSNTSLSDFAVNGNMQVENGTLGVVASGEEGEAYLTYTLPEQYTGKAYMVEIDHIGHTNAGGLLIGAEDFERESEPVSFVGYSCGTDANNLRIIMKHRIDLGEIVNMASSTVKIDSTPDLHYAVKVQRGRLTLYVYKLGETTPLYISRYDVGNTGQDSTYSDENDAFTSTMGIFQSYSDAGRFDNFKVTILDDDTLPTLGSSVTFGETKFASSGVSLENGTVSGTGAMLSEDVLSGSYRVTVDLAAKGISRMYFGMADAENGFAFEINAPETAVFLYRIVNGTYILLGEKENIIRSDFTTVTLDIHEGVTSLYYDNYYENGKENAKLEFYLGDTEGKLGFWLEGGSLKNLEIGETTYVLPEETYLNPVNPGADPDVLYYDGVYYLYVYSSVKGDEVFRVYTSPDLVHFTERNIIFKWKDEYSQTAVAQSSWSPNVSYYDGKFYLFFAAIRIGYEEQELRSVYYATADSPYGPFVFDGPLEPVNPIVYDEIDGHPFYDDDGRIYMSFSRYDEGGTIWVEEVAMEDGKVYPLSAGKGTRVLVPDREWENDGQTRLIEGGYIWKHEGYYYMIYATGSYARHYGEAYAVATNPMGPYEKYEYSKFLIHNYVLDGPGDALIVPSPDGTELYLVYHRHFASGKTHLRQTCIDLIEFVDDPDGGPDIITTSGPSSTPQRVPSHKYRYDVNRDGTISLADVLEVMYNRDAGINGYSGYHDVDADGDVSIHDAIQLIKKCAE